MFWHKWKWTTRRCPAGAAAQRRLAATRSCLRRHKITFGSSRTSCKCQVCKEILDFNGGNCSQTLCSLGQNLPITFGLCVFSFQWSGLESASPGKVSSSSFDLAVIRAPLQSGASSDATFRFSQVYQKSLTCRLCPTDQQRHLWDL